MPSASFIRCSFVTCKVWLTKVSIPSQDARHAAEAEIYTNLNAKIDQFLQLADYDWMAAPQGGENLSASDYLVDLITFLRSTFTVFTNLPVSALAERHLLMTLNL